MSNFRPKQAHDIADLATAWPNIWPALSQPRSSVQQTQSAWIPSLTLHALMRPTVASFQSRPMHGSPSPCAQLPIQAMHTLLATGNLAVGPDATLGQDY